MTPKVWTPENIEILTALLRNGFNSKECARKLNTTPDAVSSAIRRYDLGQNIVQKNYINKYLEQTDFEVLDDKNFKEIKQKAKLNWKIPKSTKTKTKKAFDIALLWPDTHIPHEKKPACKAVIK
jgi:hypothetical protein